MRTRVVFAALILSLLGSTGCDQIFGPGGVLTASEIEDQIFDLVNRHRASLNLNTLEWNDGVAGIARGHSQDMADGTVPFGHDGFYDRMAQIQALVSCRMIGEVVAYSDTAENAVNALIASNDHRDILEGDYDLTGVGVVLEKSGPGFYATQMFVKR